MENGSGGNGSGVVPHEAVALERADAELALDQRHGKIASPHPVFNAGACGDLIESGGQIGA